MFKINNCLIELIDYFKKTHPYTLLVPNLMSGEVNVYRLNGFKFASINSKIDSDTEIIKISCFGDTYGFIDYCGYSSMPDGSCLDYTKHFPILPYSDMDLDQEYMLMLFSDKSDMLKYKLKRE